MTCKIEVFEFSINLLREMAEVETVAVEKVKLQIVAPKKHEQTLFFGLFLSEFDEKIIVIFLSFRRK